VLQVALFEPEIPPNTGNIIRLCANTGAALNLIHPLGFYPTDKQLQRAGLDYHAWANVSHHEDYAAFKKNHVGKRIIACSTKGKHYYTDIQFDLNDILLFGPETRGLPAHVLGELPESQIVRIPMLGNSRSLNLSNSVAIVLYEALRQLNFFVLSLK